MSDESSDYFIPAPCSEPLDNMTRREGGWYCARCEHEVVDTRSMTREEFERYDASASDDLCVLFRYGADGELLFASPEQKRWQKQLAGVARLIATASIPPLLLAGCLESDSRSREADGEAVPSLVEAAEPTMPAATRPATMEAPEEEREAGDHADTARDPVSLEQALERDGKDRKTFTSRQLIQDLDVVMIGRIKRPRKSREPSKPRPSGPVLESQTE